MKVISFAVACAALTGVSAQRGWSTVGDTYYVNWNTAEAPFTDIEAKVGENIAFNYGSGSDIIAFKNQKNYDKCNLAKSMSLAKSDHGGGAGGSNLFKTELSQAGILYLASTSGCKAGQKLILTIKAPVICGAHSHDASCAGSHSPHEDEEEMAAPLNCGSHSHDPRCAGSHSPHMDEEPAAPDCSSHSHDPRCPGSHSAADHKDGHSMKASASASTTSSACFAPATSAPSAPRAGAAAVKKSTSVTLVWAAPNKEHDSRRGDKYKVSYGTNSVETADTTIVIKNLDAGSVNKFKVVAVNAMGESRALNIAVKTKKSRKGL